MAPRDVTADPFERLANKWSAPNYKHDIRRWAWDRLGIELWSMQWEIGDAITTPGTKGVLVRSCHDSGKCAAAEDWLYLANGSRVRYGDAVGRNDLQVLAWDEASGKQIPAAAIATDNGTKPIFELVTSNGRRIRRTAEHPLWKGGRSVTRSRSVRIFGWCSVAQLIPGDLVLVPTELSNLGVSRVTDDEVSLLGYLIADGSLGGVGVSFTKKEGPVRQHFQEISERMGCKTVVFDKNGQSLRVNAGTFHGQNRILELIKAWGLHGKKSAAKFLPEWVWELPDDQLVLLARSLFDCDGWLRETAASYSTISERLIRDVEFLMLRIGISGAVVRTYKFIKAAGRMYEYFTWKTATNRDLEKFANVVGSLQYPERILEMLEWCATRQPRYERYWMTTSSPEGYHWETVRSVVEEEAVPTVSLSVPGYETYLTSFVEHNTLLAAVVACHHLDQTPIGEGRVISTAPTGAQVRGLLWNEIGQMWERAAERGNPLPGRVNQTEWWIGNYMAGVGRKPGDYDQSHMSGYHARYPLVIADEADGLSADLWAALDTLLTNRTAKLFGIGNPDDTTSHFHSLQKIATSLGYQAFKISAWDTPNFSGEKVSELLHDVLLSEDWVRAKRMQWGGPIAAEGELRSHVDHPMWASKVEAEYPDESELTIIRAGPLSALTLQLEDATGKPIRPFGPVALGIDVAGSEGGDETVVRERIGKWMMREWTIQSGDPTLIEEFIIECAQISGATVITIDVTGGYGFGFLAGLRRELPRVAFVEFNFGAGAEDKEHFKNARAELWWRGWELTRDQGWNWAYAENADATMGQLAAARKLPGAKVLQVESKDDLRKRMGRSPDNADAALLAAWHSATGGNLNVTSPAGQQLPTGVGSVTRSAGSGPRSGAIPTGAAGVIRRR